MPRPQSLLSTLQKRVRDREAFLNLDEYFSLAQDFLKLLETTNPTRIVSPTHHNYIFFQYSKDFNHRITRPLNSDLYIEKNKSLSKEWEYFLDFLVTLRKREDKIINETKYKNYITSRGINRIVYTIQQSIGSIGDSFDNSNQSRKLIGQLFETLIKLIIKEIGIACEPRKIQIPLPGFEGYSMSYELDFVFSRNKAILTSETELIHQNEIVGSVKTTSKDRIDKIFLDKHLLTKLLGRNIPVIAIFLHDVQRARRANSDYGINSTFKSNHFLGYTLALNKLDGVYYVDPRPEMTTNRKLKEEILDFSKFLTHDLWVLTGK